MNLARIADTAPPQSIEAEMAVIGSMLIAPEAIDAVKDMLTFSDFYREAHGIIFSAICSLHRTGTPVDLLSVQEKLRSKDRLDECKGTPYLVNMMNSVPCWNHAEHYARIVKDKSLRRQWSNALIEAAEKMWASHDDFPAIWEDVKSIVEQTQSRART